MSDEYSQEAYIRMREGAINHFHTLVEEGQKISAVKIVNRITKLGLRAAKEIVEDVAENSYQKNRIHLFTQFLQDYIELNKMLDSLHPNARQVRQDSFDLLKKTLEAMEPICAGF